MKLYFTVEYSTKWEEIVSMASSNDDLDALDLVYVDDSHWQLSVDISDDIRSFEYSYCVRRKGEYTIREWGKPRLFVREGGVNVYHLHDQWMGIPYNSPFFSSAFSKVFFARKEKDVVQNKDVQEASTVSISVFAPDVTDRKAVAIVGNTSTLGNWQVENKLLLNASQFPLWSITLDRTNLNAATEFKFVIVDVSNLVVEEWETGENRIFPSEIPQGESCKITCGVFRGTPMKWKAAGVSIPVFSLRSEKSFGIGDFLDLRLMVEWASTTGQRVVQLLPVNDTTKTHTWTDSYPYNANTIYALHPLYLGIDCFGKLKDAETAQFALNMQQSLNALSVIDYEAVAQAKWRIYHIAYKEQGAVVRETAQYKAFVSKNREWLVPYSVFCYLRDKYHTVDFCQWGEYADYSSEKVEQLCNPQSSVFDEVAIHMFLQYFLHIQLKNVSDYARSKGVILKGDIPIGISFNSVEAWSEPSLFNLDSQTGAPPDEFSLTGQNWGFPTYNWQKMKLDGYGWWRKRFTKMSDYFDAYRIDHLLGFFRIWEIPMDAVQGVLGYFSPALPMSVEEVLARGLCFDEERFMQPYIRYYQLEEMFGTAVENIIANFLKDNGDGAYSLKPEFNTQRKIELYFNATNGDLKIRDGLYALVAEVLFVRDPYNQLNVHPRIKAQNTYSYRALSDQDKYAFNCLYDYFYFERHNQFWEEHAMQKLPDLITSNNMLACAEDLGMIPACVPSVMHMLHLLSLEIERMPKDTASRFANTNNYPYLSVAATSTHDMATLRGWWEEAGELRQEYYNKILGQSGEAPDSADAELCSTIIRNHLRSPSMLAILPLQDWLSIDPAMRRNDPTQERINEPANPNHYWRFRMHLSLEQLNDSDSFNVKLRKLIQETGR